MYHLESWKADKPCPVSCFLCTSSGIIAWRWLDFTSTFCYISSSLRALALNPGTEQKKKNHWYLSFYHLMSLGWAKSFQVGVLGVLGVCTFPSCRQSTRWFILWASGREKEKCSTRPTWLVFLQCVITVFQSICVAAVWTGWEHKVINFSWEH